jgi:hypothetical protein
MVAIHRQMEKKWLSSLGRFSQIYTPKNKYRNLAIIIYIYIIAWHLKASKIIFIFKNYSFTLAFWQIFTRKTNGQASLRHCFY